MCVGSDKHLLFSTSLTPVGLPTILLKNKTEQNNYFKILFLERRYIVSVANHSLEFLTLIYSLTLSINHFKMILIIYCMSHEPLNDQSLNTLKKTQIPLFLMFQSSPKQYHLLYNVSIFKLIVQWDAYFSTIPRALEKSVSK